jgi:hypothetical protein
VSFTWNTAEPAGVTVIFLSEAVDGNLLDIVAKDGTVLATSTFGRFRLGRLR